MRTIAPDSSAGGIRYHVQLLQRAQWVPDWIRATPWRGSCPFPTAIAANRATATATRDAIQRSGNAANERGSGAYVDFPPSKRTLNTVRSTQRWLQARVPVEQGGKLAREHSGSGWWRAACVCMVVVLIACVSGCASSVRVYEGERRARDEVAILTDSGCSTVVLVVIDDHDRMKTEKVPSRWSAYTAEVLPGRHWATVKWVASWREEPSTAAVVGAIAVSLLAMGGGGPAGGATGTRMVPASTGSLQFSFHAKAGHKYRVRQSEGPDEQASNAVKQCWQYIGLVTIEEREPTNLWLIDETALREVGSE